MIDYFIIALNESTRIADCIDSIRRTGGSRIFVLDGGSTDHTVEVATNAGAQVISLPGSSISFRRGYALHMAVAPYICFVDADQRLLPEQESAMLEVFNTNPRLAGIQFSLRADDQCVGYWAQGFSRRLKLITGNAGPRQVIGTPCIFRCSLVKNIAYDNELTGSSDDTLFCSRIIQAGYTLEAVALNAVEIVRGSFRTTVRKAFWYGRGDAEYLRFDGVNRYRHLYHVLVRGPVLQPLAVLGDSWALVPFFLIFGMSRAAGLLFGLLHRQNLSGTTS